MRLKIRWVALGLVCVLGLSACGLFQKKCNCPHFEAKNTTTTVR